MYECIYAVSFCLFVFACNSSFFSDAPPLWCVYSYIYIFILSMFFVVVLPQNVIQSRHLSQLRYSLGKGKTMHPVTQPLRIASVRVAHTPNTLFNHFKIKM